MSNNMVDDETYLRAFDFEAHGVQRIKHPLIQHAQMRSLLADDVVVWLAKQDAATQHHINEVIRHFMAVSGHD